MSFYRGVVLGWLLAKPLSKCTPAKEISQVELHVFDVSRTL